MLYKTALEKLEKKMNLREKFFIYLKNFEEKNNFIPAVYANDQKIMKNYKEFLKVGSWRDQISVVKKIRKAARKMSKNEH